MVTKLYSSHEFCGRLRAEGNTADIEVALARELLRRDGVYGMPIVAAKTMAGGLCDVCHQRVGLYRFSSSVFCSDCRHFAVDGRKSIAVLREAQIAERDEWDKSRPYRTKPRRKKIEAWRSTEGPVSLPTTVKG